MADEVGTVGAGAVATSEDDGCGDVASATDAVEGVTRWGCCSKSSASHGAAARGVAGMLHGCCSENGK